MATPVPSAFLSLTDTMLSVEDRVCAQSGGPPHFPPCLPLAHAPSSRRVDRTDSITSDSRATEERGSASSSVPIHAPRPDLTLPPCHSATWPLLASLLDPSLSLLDIANKHNLTLEALAALLTRPDIAERVDELHILAAQRARLVASQHLAAAASALASILHVGNDRAESAPLDLSNPRHLALRLRQRESTRRAATTLLRISTYSPRRWLVRSDSPHREAVAVSSRGLPRSGTPGTPPQETNPSPPGLNAPAANPLSSPEGCATVATGGRGSASHPWKTAPTPRTPAGCANSALAMPTASGSSFDHLAICSLGHLTPASSLLTRAGLATAPHNRAPP